MADESGLEGLDSDLELPFRVTNCQRLSDCMAPPSTSDMPDLFFPRLDQLPASDTQMTDLTNSLPRQANSLLAKLDCSDLTSTLTHIPDDRGLDAELFGAVYDGQYASVQSGPKPLEPTDVYGRVTCYDGKIVLQLRLLNLNTNFPINVSECWLCRNKVHGGSQMYAHKHMFHGIFQVNDEYVHLIIPESEPEIDKSTLHTSFNGPQSTDFTRNINSAADLDFHDVPVDTEDNFTLPYMAQAFGLDDRHLEDNMLDNRRHSEGKNVSNSSYVGIHNESTLKCPTDPTASNSIAFGHNIHTAVDNIYNMCNTNSGNNRGSLSTNSSDEILKFSHYSKEPPSESAFLHSLENFSPQKSLPVSENRTNKIQLVKKTEIGAKKRKSKAQKKPSAIRMKDDIPPNGVSYYLADTQTVHSTVKDGIPLALGDTDRTQSLSALSSLKGSKVTPYVRDTVVPEVLASTTSCADINLLRRSQKQLDANFMLVKRIIEKTEDVICKFCKTGFGRNLSDYKKHMMTKHGETEGSIYQCPICDKKFGFNKHLVQHVKIHLGIKAFKCDKCGTTYGREESLKRHLMTHNKKRPHACSICPKSFSRAEYLTAHMQAHNRTRHVCEKCGIVCSSKFNLDIHLKKHYKEKPFVCELCNKSFVRSDFLDNHMEVVHKKNKPKCTLCGKLFSRKDVLKRHMSTRHNQMSYDCKLCLKVFSRKDRLLAHKRTHEANNELKCSRCPAAFFRREVLLKHQKLHDNKHQCHICFKFSVSKAKLVVHLNCHNKASSSGSEVKAVHTCETCGKTLTRKDLLRKHIRRVHGRALNDDQAKSGDVKREKQFQCNICSKGFTRSCNLRTHMLKMHTTKSQEEDDPDDLDSLNSALNKSRQSHSNLVDLSSWTIKHHNAQSYISELSTGDRGSFNINNAHSLLAVSNASGTDKEPWYPQSGSASPASHLTGNLSLPQLQHPHSPINLSAEAITAAAYLLAYPSYLGPYQ